MLFFQNIAIFEKVQKGGRGNQLVVKNLCKNSERCKIKVQDYYIKKKNAHFLEKLVKLPKQRV